MRAAAQEALQEHGLTGEQLLGLSRKAATDAVRRKGAFLDEHHFEDLADYMLEVAVRYAPRFELGHGIGMSTFLYRRMRIRFIDWLRVTLGDSRLQAVGGRSTRPVAGSTPSTRFATRPWSTAGSKRWRSG